MAGETKQARPLEQLICPDCGRRWWARVMGNLEVGSPCPNCDKPLASSLSRPLPRWWRYAVLRGDGIPAELDGRWYDLDETPDVIPGYILGVAATTEATNRWEQRDDGAVAVVYEWIRRG